jgi:hypothetical protein
MEHLPTHIQIGYVTNTFEVRHIEILWSLCKRICLLVIFSCDKYIVGTTYRNTMVIVYVCVLVHTMTNAFVCYSGITSSVHIKRVPTDIQMHLSCDQYVAGTTYRKTTVSDCVRLCTCHLTIPCQMHLYVSRASLHASTLNVCRRTYKCVCHVINTFQVPHIRILWSLCTLAYLYTPCQMHLYVSRASLHPLTLNVCRRTYKCICHVTNTFQVPHIQILQSLCTLSTCTYHDKCSRMLVGNTHILILVTGSSGYICLHVPCQMHLYVPAHALHPCTLNVYQLTYKCICHVH